VWANDRQSGEIVWQTLVTPRAFRAALIHQTINLQKQCQQTRRIVLDGRLLTKLLACFCDGVIHLASLKTATKSSCF
jgi:hypothetical protein